MSKKELGASYYNRLIPDSISQYWVDLYNTIICLLPDDVNIKIADLGCGPGLFAEFPFNAGYVNYWGIDFAKECIKLARKRVPSYKYTVGNLYDKNIQKEFKNYDVFISVESLEHMTNDLEVIKAIPKGKQIILSVPNAGDESHVRCFKKASQVRERYSSLIEFTTELSMPGVRTKRFFIVSGIRK